MTDAPLNQLLRERFGFSSFRPYQEQVCLTATQGQDLLLVMPTGAGKSLCYQLPGIARKGTTLVISPLIALMEDQCLKLQKTGFRAERIHAGRERQDSRQACLDYLSGNLDFLFIAPERLAVPGFLEMLAKRIPALIAIDEAHCISQWGHDFRPEYRMLGERLPQLRPAPIIAMTATATERVQDDIVTQLNLKNEIRYIHGFRRTNLAIEVIERNPSEREDAILGLLDRPDSMPAIVYAPTRKEADELAKALRKKKLKAHAYHAGHTAENREEVQNEFINGKTQVIVATIAFGMGIDKSDVRTVIHAALPSSVEGYYQEIGRAGRDGLPSRVVLLYSYADQKTHEFFYERDYPEVAELDRIYSALPEFPQKTSEEYIRLKFRLKEDTLQRMLNKLQVHQAVRIDSDGMMCRGANLKWQLSYQKQREHKSLQLAHVLKYAQAPGCRMALLIKHFGEKDLASCGICDFCNPDAAIAKKLREVTIEERASAQKILNVLRVSVRGDGIATGRLFQDSGLKDRKDFEHLLRGLTQAGLVELQSASFEKNGKKIDYLRASLTVKGNTEVAPSFSVEMKFSKKKQTRSRTKKTSKKRAYFAGRAR